MKTKITKRRAQVAAFVVLAVMAPACGDDDDEAQTRTVTAADYAFRNLPKEVKAGTVLRVTNESTKEIHELVAMRILDTEKRPVSELVRLPEEQLNAVFAPGPPAMVLVAPPSRAPQIQAVGNGSLNAKGRYAIVCFIPTGADPAAYLAAAQSSGDGPPPQVSGGPPHAAQGMFAELKVE